MFPARSRQAIPGPEPVAHLFTVDVEEHFHVNAFDRLVSRDDWDRLPSRVERNVDVLLDLLPDGPSGPRRFKIKAAAQFDGFEVSEIKSRPDGTVSFAFRGTLKGGGK